MNWNELIGRQLGRYLLVEDIGVGGSSRVYRGQDTYSDREVAVKVLPNDAEDSVGFVRRFEREVQVVAQLSHPNIVAIFDSGKTDDVVYLVMQLVRGGTLRNRLGRPLPVAEATAAMVQMAFALHHAHTRGIIHRDVKPSNMLVSAEDPRHLLLSDFGIAKLQGLRGLTKSGTTIGTPEYMSPEQAEGKEIDPRADVYSLGCVLYEALSGRPPFVGATPVSVLYQQVHSRPSYLRGLNAEVPRELSRLLNQALAKHPEERFATAERFAEVLLPFAEGALPPITFPRESRESGPLQAYGPHTVVPGRSSPRESEPALQGLGEEGLDAIFPDGSQFTGGRRVVHSRPLVGGELIEASPGWSDDPRPFLQPEERRSIPLPAFSLPTKDTRKLNLPLTADGQLDMDTLLSSIDGAPVPTGRISSSRLSSPRLSSPSLSGGRSPRAESEPVWRPPLRDSSQKVRAATRPGADRRPLWTAVSVAALLIISIAVWIAVSASARGVTTVTATHPAATYTPVPTATSTTSASPTLTQQQQQQALDRQAAASFQSITMSNFTDRTCNRGNASNQFALDSTPSINLCASSTMSGGPITLYIKQDAHIVYTIGEINLDPHGWTSHSKTLSHFDMHAGACTLVVTLRLTGKEATAATISFTVN